MAGRPRISLAARWMTAALMCLARSISGGRVNVVGLRLPEDEEEVPVLTRKEQVKRRLADVWSSVAGV